VTLGQVNYQINMKYYMKTVITEFGITGVGTRDAGTSEFSNFKTATLEFGITGGFPKKCEPNIFDNFFILLNKKLINALTEHLCYLFENS
jgi:hypothetical protein